MSIILAMGNFFHARLQILQINLIIHPNLDSDYIFTIDLTPSRILFGAESIGKV